MSQLVPDTGDVRFFTMRVLLACRSLYLTCYPTPVTNRSFRFDSPSVLLDRLYLFVVAMPYYPTVPFASRNWWSKTTRLLEEVAIVVVHHYYTLAIISFAALAMGTREVNTTDSLAAVAASAVLVFGSPWLYVIG